MLGRFLQPECRVITLFAVCTIAVSEWLVGDVNAQSGDAAPTHAPYQNEFAGDAHNSQQSMLPATDLSLSLLSFAVGVAACLLVVRAMLPTLVRAHCAEIVRDYIDRNTPETGIKVVVVDRDSQTRGNITPESAPRTTVAGRHVRVDEKPTVPAPSQVATARDNAEPQSILGRVYEQNVRLRDQLRAQAERNHL